MNRVDYAIDFLMPPAFEAGLEQFVAHPHSKLKPYWGKRDAGEPATQPTALCRGRRLESVTVGKMLKTRFGYHVVRLDRRVDGRQLPFDVVKDKIADYLHEHVWRRAVSQYLQLLVGQAEILGIELSGARTPLVQ